MDIRHVTPSLSDVEFLGIDRRMPILRKRLWNLHMDGNETAGLMLALSLNRTNYGLFRSEDDRLIEIAERIEPHVKSEMPPDRFQQKAMRFLSGSKHTNHDEGLIAYIGVSLRMETMFLEWRETGEFAELDDTLNDGKTGLRDSDALSGIIAVRYGASPMKDEIRGMVLRGEPFSNPASIDETTTYMDMVQEIGGNEDILHAIIRKTRNAFMKRAETPSVSGNREPHESLSRCFRYDETDIGDIDTSCIDEDGWTPLHYAVSGRNENTLRCLVEHGHVFSEDTDGRTPLDYAKGRLSESAVALLESVALRWKHFSTVNKPQSTL